jgi:putative ABC transport system permease protein
MGASKKKNYSMIHRIFIWRQLTRSLSQAGLFILCVALSILVITAVNGFKEDVQRAILKDARTLHAADVIIHSHTPLSEALLESISKLRGEGRIEATRVYEFYSVVRTSDENASLLSQLKIAEAGYPFYGKVVLGSGRSFSKVLTIGKVIAEPLLLERLGLKIGDHLIVGDRKLIIADTVQQEPDRPLSVFSLGPRLFIHIDDLYALNLLGKGSRSHYNCLIKVNDAKKINTIAKELRNVADLNAERIDTFQTARSGVKRFLDNFLFFLSLTGIFCLIIAGFGIQSTLWAFLKDKQTTIATLKTLGATHRFILTNYSLAVMFLDLIGSAMGILSGWGLQFVLPMLMTKLLPAKIISSISISGLIQSLFLASLGVLLFTFVPLSRLENIHPKTIFRKEPLLTPKKISQIGATVIGTIFFAIIVLWQLNDRQIGLYFMLAVAGLIIFTALITQVILTLLKRISPSVLSLRQAIIGLFRPQNATRLTIITLCASLSVIMTLLLVEKNINATYISAYPPKAPNLFFLDIQPTQLNAFKKELGQPTRFYPLIRARVMQINNHPIDHRAERRKKGDNLGREFNLTYRSDLLKDEELEKGRNLFRSDWSEPQVSVMDTVTEMYPMRIGDRISFNIQGVAIIARISSIRSRTQSNLSPFFYFVFPPDILNKAPQTIFTALKVSQNEMGKLQNKMVAQFPNVSVIDVSATIDRFADVLNQLARMIRFFTSFSTIAGILIFISALLSTRAVRIREIVYYKILGAKRNFVLSVLVWENLIMGLMAGGLATFISHLVTFMICRHILKIEYQWFLKDTIFVISSIIVVILLIGLVVARPLLAQKPIAFLRENNDE